MSYTRFSSMFVPNDHNIMNIMQILHHNKNPQLVHHLIFYHMTEANRHMEEARKHMNIVEMFKSLEEKAPITYGNSAALPYVIDETGKLTPLTNDSVLVTPWENEKNQEEKHECCEHEHKSHNKQPKVSNRQNKVIANETQNKRGSGRCGWCNLPSCKKKYHTCKQKNTNRKCTLCEKHGRNCSDHSTQDCKYVKCSECELTGHTKDFCPTIYPDIRACGRCGFYNHEQEHCKTVACRNCYNEGNDNFVTHYTHDCTIKFCQKCNIDTHNTDDCDVIICKICKKNHEIQDCPDAVCTFCGEVGHIRPKCPDEMYDAKRNLSWKKN